jgi:beta-N-acetylhexosaminidase
MTVSSWDEAYAGVPAPWDIGRPQPAFARLAEQGLLSGRVLDSGCGTGEHALLAAAHGADAVGVDVSGRAIQRARDKAAERGLAARFEVADALRLVDLGLTFDTIIDSGMFHVFDDEDRARYVASLAPVLRPGGFCYLMCFSDRQPGDAGPRRVRQDELRAAFGHGWTVTSIEAAEFDLNRAGLGIPSAQAWLAVIERTGSLRARVRTCPRRRLVVACAVWLSLICSGCSAPAPASGPSRGPLTSAKPRSELPSPASPPSCPAQVFSRMTEAQRVGQLFLVGIAGDPAAETADAVATYHFGSLLFGADKAGVAGIRPVTGAIQALASPHATGGVRFLVAANQEGGQVQALQGPGFSMIPPALVQGQLPAATLQQQAAGWGRELAAAGVNLNLAPVMDVVPPGTAGQNQPIGALQREFGDNPATVAAHGVAFIQGMRQAGVATAAKHFPGLGRVRGNTDFTAGITDTTTTPDDPYLRSFQAAIDAGVPFVMVALATYTRIDPDHLAAFSSRVMRVMLRQQMRFQGVIISDDLGVAAAVAGISPAARGVAFLAAGGDMITSQALAPAAAMDRAILERAAADSAFRAVVNSAAMRVLSAKQAYGLLPCP